MCRVPNFGTILILLYRALADVEALDRVLMKTELVNLLSNLPVRSAAQQLGMWIFTEKLPQQSHSPPSCTRQASDECASQETGRVGALVQHFTGSTAVIKERQGLL